MLQAMLSVTCVTVMLGGLPSVIVLFSVHFDASVTSRDTAAQGRLISPSPPPDSLSPNIFFRACETCRQRSTVHLFVARAGEAVQRTRSVALTETSINSDAAVLDVFW